MKKAECQRIDVLWYWRRLLRVPWTASSNQSILRKSTLNIYWKYWCWSWSSKVWLPDGKNWLIRKDPDAGKDWGQEEKWTTEGEMVGCHPRLDGHEFEKTLGDSEGQESLVCCSPWGPKSGPWLSDRTTAVTRGAMQWLHTLVIRTVEGCFQGSRCILVLATESWVFLV